MIHADWNLSVWGPGRIGFAGRATLQATLRSTHRLGHRTCLAPLMYNDEADRTSRLFHCQCYSKIGRPTSHIVGRTKGSPQRTYSSQMPSWNRRSQGYIYPPQQASLYWMWLMGFCASVSAIASQGWRRRLGRRLSGCSPLQSMTAQMSCPWCWTRVSPR